MKKTLLLTLAGFLLLTVYFSRSSDAVLLDRIVAVVNNEIITWSELRNTIEIEGQGILEGFEGAEREDRIREIRKDFLNAMIDIQLQIQEARNERFAVSDSETDGVIEDIKKKYKLTDENLAESIKNEGMSMKEYRTKLSEQILLSKVVRFKINDKILIDDKDIEKYYESNREEFRLKEKVRIRQIFFARPEDASLIPGIENLARETAERIRNGEDFAEMAKELSEDASREFGGDLGYVSRGNVMKEIENVAFHMQSGEVSEPFWSPSGLHIIKVEDGTAGLNVEEIKDEIKDRLFKEAFKARLEDWVKTLREKAYIEILL
jgi:peptidyl-prolyl cis-trans isomerase SurA